MHIVIINGPNLNLLGIREPDVYGSVSFEDFFTELQMSLPDLTLDYFQSNSEGDIINLLHQYGFRADGIVLNPAGYTHTSVAIADAVAAIRTPVIEVHISNLLARESFRHQSFVAARCKGVIAGFGLESYRLAIFSFLKKV